MAARKSVRAASVSGSGRMGGGEWLPVISGVRKAGKAARADCVTVAGTA
jgi:hypothetical protein